MMNMMKDVRVLRVSAIIGSLLFIPAFMMGVASIWAALFGLVIALFFDARIAGLIERTETITDKARRSKMIIGYYCLLTCEMTALGSIIPIAFLNSGYPGTMSALDSALFDYSPFIYWRDGGYADQAAAMRVFLASTFPLFVALAVGMFLTSKKLSRFSSPIMFFTRKKDSNGNLIFDASTAFENRVVHALGNLSLYGAGAIIIYFFLLAIHVDFSVPIESALFLISVWLCLYLFVGFVFVYQSMLKNRTLY